MCLYFLMNENTGIHIRRTQRYFGDFALYRISTVHAFQKYIKYKM